MSNTYVCVRKMFYLTEKDVIKVVAREKTPNGNALVKTVTKGLDDIQFPIPYEILENQHFFVAIHDNLFEKPIMNNPHPLNEEKERFDGN